MIERIGGFQQVDLALLKQVGWVGRQCSEAVYQMLRQCRIAAFGCDRRQPCQVTDINPVCRLKRLRLFDFGGNKGFARKGKHLMACRVLVGQHQPACQMTKGEGIRFCGVGRV